MDQSETNIQLPRLRIGIVGAGFSGTAFAVACYRQKKSMPIDIFLFEKTGHFGVGEAYKTPFPFHLLNVQAKDMSAVEDDPDHFVNWLKNQPACHSYFAPHIPIQEQFMPRFLYGNYLKSLLDEVSTHPQQDSKFFFESNEVIKIITKKNHAELILKDHRTMIVDKVVLALGNYAPVDFPFSVSSEMQCIKNAWDYQAPKKINTHDPVLIVGTGLSMIDTVLTLYHQGHQGKIHALSRHGLLPLPHANVKIPYQLNQAELPETVRHLTKDLRHKIKIYREAGGDWRSVINALRGYVPSIWARSTLKDKKKFLRHLLPYWNIHRHRVHQDIAKLLTRLIQSEQLQVISGRVLSADQHSVTIKKRHKNEELKLKVKWLINCTGPSLYAAKTTQPIIQSLLFDSAVSLDSLELGFDVSPVGAIKVGTGHESSILYTLGPLAKGAFWETSAVPEIRKQCFNLATHLFYTSIDNSKIIS